MNNRLTDKHFAVCAVIFSIVSASQMAWAQNSTISPLQPLYDCSKIQDNSQRLACYDEKVNQLAAKEATSEVVAIDAPKLQQLRKEAFGFRMPSLPKISMPKIGIGNGSNNDSATIAQEEQEERQTMTVTRITSGSRPILTMDNGQVWQLTEAADIRAPSRPPFQVTIRSAMMGSYLLSVEGRNKGYRIRRVE